ncbi:2-oxo-4-hydroxy-4-carboxy-5-ureidoimidazoline decarboxylase [soil metagenome]
MTIAAFDHLPMDEKRNLLTQCCGASVWVDKMLKALPVEDLVDLMETAEEKWYECNKADWKEAFSHHPKIGDINSLKEKFASTAKWAAGEQSGVNNTADDILNNLSQGNRKYEEKFGYIFIVCATGKSAEQMNLLLRERINNDTAEEIKIAAEEQNKITMLRLQKLFT